MNTPVSNSKNVLNSDVELKGTLKFSGDLTFDGKLEGDINSDGTLNLGDNAILKGNIEENKVQEYLEAEKTKTESVMSSIPSFDSLMLRKSLIFEWAAQQINETKQE